MRILWLGTGDIGLPSLKWLVEASGHEVIGCVCQPDKPAGRKMVLTPPATKLYAVEKGLLVLQPERIKETSAEITSLSADLLVVMAYGQYLPKAVREAGRYGCINLHASLLPRWRGASPVQSALAAGDTTTGVTVMHVFAGMDTGDMILAEETPILPSDTGQLLHDRLAEIAAVALARAVPLIFEGNAPRTAQDESQATHCAKLTRDLGVIDWSKSAKDIARLIRAYDPWPGTSTTLPDGRSLKLFPYVEIIESQPTQGSPGQLIAVEKSFFEVACGQGSLRFSETIQPEGKRRMTVGEFLAGKPFSVGAMLG